MRRLRNPAMTLAKATRHLGDHLLGVMRAVAYLAIDSEPRRVGFADMGPQGTVIARLAFFVCLAMLIAA